MENNSAFLSLKLPLLFTEFLNAGSYWNYQDVLSPFSRIMVVISGEGMVYHSGREFHLSAGSMLLVPKYTMSNYSCKESMGHYYILFNDEMVGGGGIYDIHKFNYTVRATEEDFYLANRLLQLNPDRKLPHLNPKYYDNKSTLYNYSKKNDALNVGDLIETHGILLQLFSKFIHRDRTTYNRSENLATSRLSEVTRYIEINLEKPMTIEELAQIANLCPDYFSRLFYKIMGVKPTDYINRKRVERAKQMLITSNYSYREISSKVGIDNYTYFFTIFKKYTGLSPAQYQKGKKAGD